MEGDDKVMVGGYDKIMLGFDGELCFFGGHYGVEECLKLIDEEEFDDSSLWKPCVVEHCYAKFGIHSFEGEPVNGWIIKNEPAKGRVPCTILTKQYE